ncbi:hypothetical protein PFICI_11132 [Pestalotiopsis fici W106-1]|uniref:FAD-binding domain-containing protein n=1 Tax=Pestalotiopsis fici (strain W106-1 / CGMCC3.15140) TaxID=1229662 RepID=W3WTS2_PESFW|nr:uncharacterized protein PFICI_11132 [Pestalotiopsis fici W106-1]ETS77258.1 hypothetical protein PFICI_11132 [Pestalotiopsis fici W106-1]
MANTDFKVIIVGGGPVGLTAAHALSHAGIDFVVLEGREDMFLDSGASLVLNPASLRVMQQLGLLPSLKAIGAEMHHIKGYDLEGNTFEDHYGFNMVKTNLGIGPFAFHRSQLIEAIYNGLSATAKEKVLAGKRVMDIETKSDGVRVHCSDGSVHEGSIVIGADGVHSRTRRAMRKLALEEDPLREWDAETPFLTSYKCVWCSFPRPDGSVPGDGFNTHNTDKSTMYISGHDRSWIFLYEKLPEPTRERRSYSEKEAEDFAATFADYPITDTLKVKDALPNRMTAGMANLEEGVLKHWSWGRIVLAGDACHKFTPNAGLGFNNGVQDIVVLCNRLQAAQSDAPLDADALTKIFKDYQTERIAFVTGDESRSAHITRFHAWSDRIHYFISRFILPFHFVQRLLLNYLTRKVASTALVLDYVSAEESFVGIFPWLHKMPKYVSRKLA